MRHAPAPKAAGDPLAVVVVLVGEVEEAAGLVVVEEEEVEVDGAGIKLQVPCKMRRS